jgi:hypothetical protein
MAQSGQNMTAEVAAGAGGPGLATEQGPARRGRIVLLNALPLNALPRAHLQIRIQPVDIIGLGRWLHERLAEGYELIHYVRHQATLQTLRRELGIPLPLEPNAGLYQYVPGDMLVVVTLRSPARGQEVQQISPQDLEAWIVTVL